MLFASKNAAGQQIMGSHGSHQVLPRVSLPILGPLLFLPHTLGIFRQCLPCGLFRRVRCDPAMLMSSADCSYTRLCGQAHLCVQLPEELLLQPCPLSPQPCHGAWSWLASPSPSASSSLMRSCVTTPMFFPKVTVACCCLACFAPSFSSCTGVALLAVLGLGGFQDESNNAAERAQCFTAGRCRCLGEPEILGDVPNFCLTGNSPRWSSTGD